SELLCLVNQALALRRRPASRSSPPPTSRTTPRAPIPMTATPVLDRLPLPLPPVVLPPPLVPPLPPLVRLIDATSPELLPVAVIEPGLVPLQTMVIDVVNDPLPSAVT